MYYLKSNKADYGIYLPTSSEELTPMVLTELTKEIKLAKHYAIICLAYKTSLFKLASEIGGGKKHDSINVLPLIAKVALDDSQSPVKEQPKIGYIPVVAPSSIERGYQLYIPSNIFVHNVCKYIADDRDLSISLIQKKYEGNIRNLGTTEFLPETIIKDNSTSVYILDFKVVPISDIVAWNPIKYKVDDTVIFEENKANKE